jgi:transcriptional regulator with XRE-family HTH domain
MASSEGQIRFGERLAHLRAERGWSQEEAAQEIGISHRNYQKWEKGETRPRLTNERKIADTFEISLEELRGGSPPSPRERDQLIEYLARIEQKLDKVLNGDDPAK